MVPPETTMRRMLGSAAGAWSAVWAARAPSESGSSSATKMVARVRISRFILPKRDEAVPPAKAGSEIFLGGGNDCAEAQPLRKLPYSSPSVRLRGGFELHGADAGE